MSTIKVAQYDHVKLKDGRTGYVVEIYKKQGLPDGYDIEIDGTKMQLETVNLPDISEVIK